MKKSYLILFLLATVLNVSNAFSQANVLSSGISIQGIARDENNSALANMSSLPLIFKIYYLNASNAEVDIKNESSNVITDNFGVFSYVMTIDKTLFTTICNTQAYLKVSSGSTVFSNEKLQAVPYAIHAQNGVPTGTIMAFVGTTAPEGWLLCDGSTITDNPTNARLRELLGTTTTPNLTARYLRGAGTFDRGGITLKGTHDDDIRQHSHYVDLTTSAGGSHSHETYFTNDDYSNNGGTFANGLTKDANSNAGTNNRIYNTSTVGNHTHEVEGFSNNTGITENRVYSYGVNWIIKI
jgi:hypothetical protein